MSRIPLINRLGALILATAAIATTIAVNAQNILILHDSDPGFQEKASLLAHYIIQNTCATITLQAANLQNIAHDNIDAIIYCAVNTYNREPALREWTSNQINWCGLNNNLPFAYVHLANGIENGKRQNLRSIFQVFTCNESAINNDALVQWVTEHNNATVAPERDDTVAPVQVVSNEPRAASPVPARVYNNLVTQAPVNSLINRIRSLVWPQLPTLVQQKGAELKANPAWLKPTITAMSKRLRLAAAVITGFGVHALLKHYRSTRTKTFAVPCALASFFLLKPAFEKVVNCALPRWSKIYTTNKELEQANAPKDWHLI